LTWFAGWSLELIAAVAVLGFAAMGASLLREQGVALTNRAIMPPAFVFVFSALMLAGAPVAMVVAAAAALTPAFVLHGASARQAIVDATVVMAAIACAALGHHLVAQAVPRVFLWPWIALPLAAAVITYHVSQGALARLVVPLFLGQPVDRSWHKRALAGCPLYLLGAGLATAIVAVIESRRWDLAPIVGVGLFLVYVIYAEYVERIEEARRRGGRGDRLPRAGNVGARSRRPGDAVERRDGASAALALRRRARPAPDRDSAGARADRTDGGDPADDRGPPGAGHEPAASGRRKRHADRAGQGPAGRRRRRAAVARPKPPTTACGSGTCRRASSTCRDAGAR
jgi:hypothetical protein